MNEQDLHEIQEKLNEKAKTKIALGDLARMLAEFREALVLEGFSTMESLMLTNNYMIVVLNKM